MDSFFRVDGHDVNLRDGLQVLDFGAARDGVPDDQRGRRIVVNSKGVEVDPAEIINDDL